VPGLRIQKSCRLLLQTRMSVADICFEVGYCNLSNFNRHFLSEMQVTPTQYRRGSGVTLFNLNRVRATA